VSFFCERISFGRNSPPPPEDLIQKSENLAQNVKTPEEAKSALAKLEPLIPEYAPEARFLISCGMLLEKQRVKAGMLEAWADLQNLFPEQMLPFRMTMRWFVRMHQVDEGLQRLYQMYPERNNDLEQAKRAIIGLAELKDYVEIDHLMQQILAQFPDDLASRLQYIKILQTQGKVLEAQKIAANIKDADTLGSGTRKLLESISSNALALEKYSISDNAAVIGKMVELFDKRTPRPLSKGGIGPTVCFTGQLGAGGAERQMTRIASRLQYCFDHGILVAGQKLLSSVYVCVRHTTSASNSDFFLPMLHDAGVDVHVLNSNPAPDPEDISELTPKMREMLGFLPDDIQKNTLKLIPYFQEKNTEFAYLWQDGGVLAAALAALVAGVPRIITSFRGLPPNLRQELLRPQMVYLYKALFKVPGVIFTANSISTARAYEKWLGLETGAVFVVYNAVPAASPEGSSQDIENWEKVTSKSPECDRTVLGVFRYDHNKRATFWIDVAAAYIKTHPNTRFVIVGHGTEFSICQKKIVELGVENRIFMLGSSKHVGFYLHKADLLMHLARMEGMPNVVIEAHLASTPALATPAGGTNEILLDGITGVLLESADNPCKDRVLEKLNQLLSDHKMREEMGRAAKKHATGPFSIDQSLNGIITTFLK